MPMKYKQKVLDRLERAENFVTRLNANINHGNATNPILREVKGDLDNIKKEIDNARDFISLEEDAY